MASDIVGQGAVKVDLAGLRQLSRDINRTGDLAIRARFRQGLKDGAQHVVVAARRNASWSHRIPGSIRVGVTTRGVYVRAGSAAAPHAVTFEGTASGRPRRHPVFRSAPGHVPSGFRRVTPGDRSTWHWAAQEPRPFLLPALTANVDNVVERVANAMQEAFYDIGWRP